ncbi:DUF551 domain-containing protein [Acinetobacter towneri]|uniref:DUF551 domain-containing protein n=1 Tax=Acinetobacter towneri TaxID=202956 RepID=UPI002936325E|nr:DUF551 domain-containing protein [Acinetobacter towneri]MDV2454018.1 DUF551 domain-containing protein [Acinetobacter towneri]
MDLQKEREAFEQHLTDTGLVEFSDYGFAVDECDEYLHEPTQVAWDSWLIGLNRAKAQAVPEWISVQDRMPEQGQKVLVFRPDAHNHPHKDPNFKICTYAGADIFINSHFEHVITHWKPLESPIEAQEQAK